MNTKNFLKAVLPSMLSQMLNGFFIIVDGFFIGGAMGDSGLAAINIAWPIVAVIMSTGMGLGTGGAVLTAIARGEGDSKTAAKVRGNTLLALAAASVLLMGIFWFTYPTLLPLMGAVDNLYPLAASYIQVVILFAAVQVFSSGLLPLLRGSGKPVAAMAVMIQGLLMNIFLDWLLVWKLNWGMFGAAAATLLAQFSGVPVALVLLLGNRDISLRASDFLPCKNLLRKMVVLGASPFGLSVSVSAVILLNNVQALHYGGANAVAVYAILSYVFGSLHPLLSGVGEGSQPLISYCHGAKDRTGMRFVRKAAFYMVLCVAAVLAAGAWLTRYQAGLLFGAGPQAAEGAAQGMLWYCLCLPFFGIARICSSYFCATAQSRMANLLAFAEPLLVQPVCLVVLPMFFGVQGIWAAAFAAYFLLAVAGLAMLYRELQVQPD